MHVVADMRSGPELDVVFFVKVTKSTTKRKCRCPKGQDCLLYEEASLPEVVGSDAAADEDGATAGLVAGGITRGLRGGG